MSWGATKRHIIDALSTSYYRLVDCNIDSNDSCPKKISRATCVTVVLFVDRLFNFIW